MNPEELVQKLLSGHRKENKTALETILKFDEPNGEWTLAEKCQILRNCSSAPSGILLQIVMALLFAPDLPLRECCLVILRSSLSRPERKAVLEKLLKGKHEDILLAIDLAKEWGVRVYGEMIENLLDHDELMVVKKTVDALVHISLSAWEVAIFKRYSLLPDEVRLLLAKSVAQQKNHRLKRENVHLMFDDTLLGVRMMGLRTMLHVLDSSWISSLNTFIKQHSELEERVEAIKCMGLTQHSDAIKPLLEIGMSTEQQNEKWAVVQALENIDQKARLKIYEKLINDNNSDQLPFLFELIGSCEGEAAFKILRDALDRYSDPMLRSLIAGAMGTTGNPEAEKYLLNMLNGHIVEAYAAATALKNLMKDKVTNHFIDYLKRANIDATVKQILLQHITDTAKVITISDELRKVVEGFLIHENENLRYLAIQALSAIGSPHSLGVILCIYREDWVSMFKAEVFAALESCCQTYIRPLLELIITADAEMRKELYYLAEHHPLVIKDDDLTFLSNHDIFKEWEWDRALLPCIEKTQRRDPDFVWRQFNRASLSDRLCCFLARGFDASQPSSHELIEPKILIQCFNRFQTEKPLLLLGKLMSNFPCVEFLPPLIQYSENAEPETEMIFKSYVRKIILSLPKH